MPAKPKRISTARRRATIRHVADNLDTIPAVTIGRRPTDRTIAQADALFDAAIVTASTFKNDSVRVKRRYWRDVFTALKQAMHAAGVVRYGRRPVDGFKPAQANVIDAATEAGLIWEWRAKPGQDHQSRLIPTPMLAPHFDADPADITKPDPIELVTIKKRGSKPPRHLKVDRRHHVVRRTVAALTRINDVIADADITYRQLHRSRLRFAKSPINIRPVFQRKFIDDLDHHGRLYADHQSLSEAERATIRIDNEPTVERDFGGCAPRMLYDLKDIDPGPDFDPYSFVPVDAADDSNARDRKRDIGKKLLNAAINAKSKESAVAACNVGLSTMTNDGRRKNPEGIAEAMRLTDDLESIGMTFAELYDVMAERHRPIAHHFGSDFGLQLMRVDSSIALDVMDHFARLGIVCLGVHDSFVIAERHDDDLIDIMRRKWLKQWAFDPVIK